MHRSLAALAALAFVSLVLPNAATADERTAARVAVADGVSGRLALHDLVRGKRLARFSLSEAPYSLTTAPDGRHVLVVEQGAGRLSVFDGGSWTEDHGDHRHTHTRRPRKLAFTIRGQKPAHVVGHGNQIALFDDGTGITSVFGLDALRSSAPVIRTLASPRAHHGVAVPLGDRTLVTVPAEGNDALPNAVSLRNRDGAEQQAFGPCPGLHGEFADQQIAAFGCQDGVLLIKTARTPTAVKVPNPPSADPNAHAGTLHGRHGSRWLLGNFGDRALMVIDRQRQGALALRFASDVEDFGVDAHSGRAFALTTDGKLRELDLARARVRRSVRAIPAFPVPEDWRTPRPQLALGGGQVLVADPARGRVIRRDARSLRALPPIHTGGKPFHMTVVGD